MAVVWAKRKVNSTAAKRKTIPDPREKIEAHVKPPLTKKNTVPSPDEHPVQKPARIPIRVPTAHDYTKPHIPSETDSTATSMDRADSLNSGPIRASTSMDYQRDVCKQFFQTGRCRYGDTCKFSHERGDAKPVHKYERSWDVQKPKPRNTALVDGCTVCSETPRVPVKPRCGHLCCESCFLSTIKESPHATCRVCAEPLGNSAESL